VRVHEYHAILSSRPLRLGRTKRHQDLHRANLLFSLRASLKGGNPGNAAVVFPLTPTLSLGERERRSLALEMVSRLGFADWQPSVLPLPKGEGRGEGERTLHPILCVILVLLAQCVSLCAETVTADPQRSTVKYESLVLPNGDAPITLNLAYRPEIVLRHPVILMLGSLPTNEVPAWSTNLVNEGYMLASFSAVHPPDVDPARRPQWLYFDQRFVHSYVLGAQRAISDCKPVMKYLARRGDVHPEKIGWMGSSSTGIPGLAVATQGPRLAAVVAFVSTGAYRQWFDTWQPNGLWRGQTNSLWPETDALLKEYDPILHADRLFPTPVLMVSGGEDKVVDPRTARAFVEAARPFYKTDPDRLRLVVYDGFGHNLPADVVRLYAEHWFHLYMNPIGAPPSSAQVPANLEQSVVRSQINAADHREIVGADGQTNAALDWIEVSKDRRGFVSASSGRSFVPWGFNYDRDRRMRLLEDYWEAEWPTVVEDFREMKQLGANVVRIHLQFARFMDAPDQPHQKSLERLGRLAKLAAETKLYLDLTGLACYRKQDVPAWYSSLGETERWDAQARFWVAVAERCGASPAIFCYDLMNEPIVPGGKREPGDWLTGELAGFHYCQFISLDQGGRPRKAIARQWVAKLAAAIRKHDQRHLITVGLLPNSLGAGAGASGFVPGAVAGSLDFLCVHLYPKTGQSKADLKTVKGFQVGKPVVIEETFLLGCTGPELRQFIEGSRKHAAGWIGFYWGQTPAELSKSTNIGDSLTAAWLKLFQEMNPN
jgi:dienelactone hydrolase